MYTADSDRYSCRSGLLPLFTTDLCSIFSLLCSVSYIIVCLFVLFLLLIVLSLLPQFMVSDYILGILRLFLLATKQESPTPPRKPPHRRQASSSTITCQHTSKSDVEQNVASVCVYLERS